MCQMCQRSLTMQNNPQVQAFQELEEPSFMTGVKSSRKSIWTCAGPKKSTFLKRPLAANFTKQKTLGMVRNEDLAKKLAKKLNRVKF